MKVLLDTNAVLPGLLRNHARHSASIEWLERAAKSPQNYAVSQHCIAEMYSVLTGSPPPFRVSPSVAVRLIHELKVTVVPRTPENYADACSRLSAAGLAGGAIYDMLHLVAAESFRADTLVTANPADFRRLPAVRAIEIVPL